MKTILCLCTIALSMFGNIAYAQRNSIPADNITALLCKKWEANYAMMAGMKVGKVPGMSEFIFEFNQDHTFSITGKEKKEGSWKYDPKKKIILLTVNGKSTGNIVSLKEGELVMLTDMGGANSGEDMDIIVVYKVKAG
jgi:hypothetical protein